MSRIDYKIELFNTLKANEHKKALEMIKTIHALETDRLSLVIDFKKFIEVLTNSHKVSAAITIGQYQEVSESLRRDGHRFPVITEEEDMDKIATMQISTRGNFVITEISVPTLK
ncbi:hypothetical protein TKK_0017148 [Trichogramma kaykai]